MAQVLATKTDGRVADGNPAVLGWLRFTRLQVVLALLLLLGIVFIRAPFRKVPDALFVSDGFGYYIYLPSVVIDRDLDLSNQLQRLPAEGSKAYFAVSPVTGRAVNSFAIGCAVLWLPFFLLAHLAVSGLALLGAPVATNGFGFPYELPVYVGSFLYGLLGVYLTGKLLARLYPEALGRVCLFAILFATPLAYYLWYEPDMSHVVSVFLIAAYVHRLALIYDGREERPAAWIVLGLLLGLVALIRPYNGLLALTTLPVARAVAAAQPSRPAAWRRQAALLAICGLAAIAVFLPQSVTWMILYGRPLVAPTASGYDTMTWSKPDFLGFALSMFPFAPLLLPAVVGLIWPQLLRALAPRWRERGAPEAAPAFATAIGPWLLLTIAGAFYIGACKDFPFAGDSYGQRTMVDWSPLFALGLAQIAACSGSLWRRRSTGAVLLGLALLNGILTVLYVLHRLPDYGLAKLWP
jgi:hypothetical protein